MGVWSPGCFDFARGFHGTFNKNPALTEVYAQHNFWAKLEVIPNVSSQKPLEIGAWMKIYL